MGPKVLVVDDEESIRYTFETFLVDDGYDVTVAKDLREALRRMDEERFDLVIADIILGDDTGLDLIREVKKRAPHCPVILITACPSLDAALEAIRFGAFDYIPKPVTQQILLQAAGRALEQAASREHCKNGPPNFEAILKGSKEAVLLVDRNLVLYEMNPALSELCGMTRADLGHSFRALKKRCGGGCVRVLETAVSTAAQEEMDIMECRHAQKLRQVVQCSAVPLMDPEGRLWGAALILKAQP